MSVDTPKTNSVQRRPDWAALVIAAILLIVAGVILFDVSRLRDVGGYSQVGPATVPSWIAYGLIGLAIWTIAAAFRGDFPVREKQEVKPVVWIVAGLAAQMLLIRPLGFSIATGVLFVLTAAGFGARRIWISIPIAIVICLGIWWVFDQVLSLSLPAGPLENLLQ
ncbi:tripartite tricarboxylate transporter TctB family protein [Neorhizobium lilium]|uniref:Tripartite tricarboxylate transporter TctB family protein n=1 Tax=Neorhizobium lilium TaxID=2503024 RepID=A0A3S3VH86_9HYPH|nr:tripartite tricarboxylate transporter TctB family protein [Neorhizobium lilium]RWX76550.1 tripartite tricarboxylate transporter TctB family protein [Neorhizobium lilium]